ncbi:MAG: UxaA family hydrolase [Actinomycetota bacterium]
MVTRPTGYRRSDGRVGVRNHVAILPVDDISNAAAEKVAAMIPGTLALPHAYGRLQFGEDLELLFRTLIGNGANPNIASVVVIGIEPKWAERVGEGIAHAGKPVEVFSIERNGDLQTAVSAARVAQSFLQDASELTREPVDLADLWVSIKCGESDTTTGLASCPTVSRVVDRVVDAGGTVFFGETTELTGGEHLIADRCIDDEVRKRFLATYEDYVRMIEEGDVDLLGSQPTEGNIRGGLTTIEEKALGNIAKTGSAPVVDVLKPAEAPTVAGLNFMDTSSAAAECVTLMAAGGAVIHLFPTGQGNVIGNPVVPVVKISGNPVTVATMDEHIDLDVSGLLTREIDLATAGERLLELVLRTANGRLSAAESLGHREFVMTKLYRSA